MNREPLTDEQVIEAIERHNGNVAEAARELGVSRQAIHKRLDARGLEVQVTSARVVAKDLVAS